MDRPETWFEHLPFTTARLVDPNRLYPKQCNSRSRADPLPAGCKPQTRGALPRVLLGHATCAVVV